MRSKSGLTIVAVPLIVFSASSMVFAAPATPCDLITREAAAAIFGGPVAAGREEKIGAGTAQCVFDGPGGNHNVSVGWMDPKALMGVNADLAFKAAQADKGKPQESISGLGEAAILNASPGDNTLSILYKGRIVIVSAVGSKNPGLKAALIQTAKQILGKM